MAKTTYDDKIEDVMKYVVMHLNDRGVRHKIRDKEDLRAVIEELDEDRGHGGRRRMNPGFVTLLVESGTASKFFGKVLGRRGREVPIRGGRARVGGVQVPADLAERLRGREVVPLRGGRTGFKQVFRVRKKQVIRFRDARTGRFVGGGEVIE